MDVEEAKQNIISYLRYHHENISIDDLWITDVKGYFRLKKKCGGKGVCSNPIHTCLFNEGGVHHTISFLDDTRDRLTGRFLSPYRTWNVLKESGMFEEWSLNEA